MLSDEGLEDVLEGVHQQPLLQPDWGMLIPSPVS